ncbi:cupin domain-containing protein [Acuticoccus sediminis]|uniref:cupin domain-containing protein n=1 Tax=Acuticoccus sediminis TaxID=2184697 RepID=UPI001CFF085F|nr:cupin domain-containing protein [Acuticoccus sediminis]
MGTRTLDHAEVVSRCFPPADGIPNHPDLPMVAIRKALAPGTGPGDAREIYASNGWGGMWTWGVFPFHHYHPDAHEALACISGSAELMIGGASGERIRVETGDVLVLPAGTGHCFLSGAPDFKVCGAYPAGQEDYTTLSAAALPMNEAAAQVARVPLPESDPIYGTDGPLTKAWGLRH